MDEEIGRVADVAVVGLGYVGLVLAVAFARAGLRVIGTEQHDEIREAVRCREPHFFERGLAQALAGLEAAALEVRPTLEGVRASAIVICVGTGYDHTTESPKLSDLRAAVDTALPAVTEGTLVVVRSTVPVGICRTAVLPRLARVVGTPLLAYCPERTIQGQALTELPSLPQIIGGLDETSAARAGELFAAVTGPAVQVSSLEAAELVKLVCNAHTDTLYGFGNEVGFIAGALGLSAREVIDAANRGYPRPDIAAPGYVGGSCLTKDPYLLVASSRAVGYTPRLVRAARAVNGQVSQFVVDRLRGGLRARGLGKGEAKVLVCGIAYKGRPETDDVRGAASVLVGRELAGQVGTLAGHDPVLTARAIARLGFLPTTIEEGLDRADGLAILTDHRVYRELDPAVITARMQKFPIVIDVWGVLSDRLQPMSDLEYVGFGHNGWRRGGSYL